MKALTQTTLALIVSLATLVVANPAHAMDSTPVTVLPLLRVLSAGGMPGPGGPTSQEITLMSDGTVTETFTQYPGYQNRADKPVKKTTVLLKIQSSKVLKNINEIVAGLKGGDIVAEDPQQPQCADAPSYSYQIVKNGKMITVAATRDCRPFQLADENQRYGASRVKSYLEALSKLSY